MARLKLEQGIVALETFFSIILILTAVMGFWAIATVLHNQSVLNGATQLAAEESLMTYDRLTYRQGAPAAGQPGSASIAATTAVQIANDVYNESARGMLADPLSPTNPKPLTIVFKSDPSSSGSYVACGPEESGSFSAANCSPSSATSNTGRVERVQLFGQVDSPLAFLTYGTKGNSRTTIPRTLGSLGVAYSAGPCALLANDSEPTSC